MRKYSYLSLLITLLPVFFTACASGPQQIQNPNFILDLSTAPVAVMLNEGVPEGGIKNIFTAGENTTVSASFGTAYGTDSKGTSVSSTVTTINTNITQINRPINEQIQGVWLIQPNTIWLSNLTYTNTIGSGINKMLLNVTVEVFK